jgi:FkbH-like protein
MQELTYSQIQEKLSQTDLRTLPELKIAILRNIMLEPIEAYLRYGAFELGYRASVKFGEYDNIVQEAIGGGADLLAEKLDYVLVFDYLETLSRNLSRNFAALTTDEVAAEIERIQAHIDLVIDGLRRQTDATILWHSWELPAHPVLGILDGQIDGGQTASIARLNDYLRRKLRQTPNSYFVDLNALMAQVGEPHWYDLRYWHIGRAPYTRAAMREIARHDLKFMRARLGKSRKCLVLDCDNTLWGGIVGEDGLEGIKLGKTYPGSAFYEFQQEILNLHRRGVIIALCSKNNEADVWEVFRNHPDMLLKEEHIAAAQINWDDKAANLRRLAADLNIGLDSMVYVDDNKFETGLVSREIPEIAVIHLPPNNSVAYASMLAGCGYFDQLTLSSEDVNRGGMYRAEAIRKNLQAQATDLKSYFQSLEMIVDIHLADDFAVPRIAQLTQKTNQFNLTTRRYSEADIARLRNDSAADVLYLKLSDQYGDSGIVGVCIVRYAGGRALFDSFLLSCRVLGRGVEEVFLSRALNLARRRGCDLAVGEYYPTSKNQQVKLFYARQGFHEIEAASSGAEKVFHYRLDQAPREEPAYFKSINTDF